MEFATLPPKNNGLHPGGRPTKKTQETIDKLVYALGLGMPDESACDYARIKRDTLDQWRKEDDEFSDILKEARAVKMAKRIEGIDAGEAGWQGKAWMLERRHGEHFARPELQVNMNVNAVVEHNVNMIPEGELHRLLGITRDIDAEAQVLQDAPTQLTDAPVEDDASQGV